MIKRGILLICALTTIFSSVNAQLNIDNVKRIFGGKKDQNKLAQHLDFFSAPDVSKRSSGSESELKAANYIGQQFSSLLYKPYFGKYIHPFNIDKKNNLSDDSFIKVFNEKLSIGTDVVIPPFSGVGSFNTQAMPGMQEFENVWFLKFSTIGEELNNRNTNGIEKMHRAAKQAINQGAEAVIFLNDEGTIGDFSNSMMENKSVLTKPVMILNHDAYEKYFVQKAKGKEWITVEYDFATTRRKAEGHNVIGLWQNQSNETIVIAARYDETSKRNSNNTGVAVLLDIAERINAARLKNFNYVLVALSGTADERKGADALIKLLKLNSNKVNCMIHIDDISALDEKHNLYLSGYGTSPDWDMAMGSIEKNFVTHRIISGEIGENNHINFYKKGIPVLNIFTKRTSDNVSLNRSGVELISASIGDMVLELDNLPKLLFSQTKPINDYRKAKFKVSLGVEPDLESGKVGVLVGAVKKGSPAEYSNIKPGDVIIRIDGHDVLDINDYITELSKFNGGDRIMIQVKRNGEAKQMLIAFK